MNIIILLFQYGSNIDKYIYEGQPELGEMLGHMLVKHLLSSSVTHSYISMWCTTSSLSTIGVKANACRSRSWLNCTW